ncbi:MAG: cation diffusion facilitator family transporter [Omnitrophica bacterium]|nr:cation diffusion facilitator family transporter [Candidatus Omnitrophota bacterium]
MKNRKIDLFQPKTCIRIGLFVNIILTIFKFFAGIVGLSKAMVADALHSLSDILTSVVAYVGICIAERPADKDHPYGHGNAETIAAVLVSVMILGIGTYVGITAISDIIQRQFRTPLNIALLAAIVSIIVKEALYRYTIKVGKMSNNPAVVADAWHHRSDAYSSVAALIGIAGAKISFLYLDPIAALVVSALIIKIATRLIRSNIGIMMDERPQAAFIDDLKLVVQETEGVRKLDSIKIHRRGSTFTVDLKIAVEATISVEEGHKIATRVRNNLLNKIKTIRDVMVHVNPYTLGG